MHSQPHYPSGRAGSGLSLPGTKATIYTILCILLLRGLAEAATQKVSCPCVMVQDKVTCTGLSSLRELDCLQSTHSVQELVLDNYQSQRLTWEPLERHKRWVRHLRVLRVVNSSVESFILCGQSSARSCQDFDSLQVLDLRNNSLNKLTGGSQLATLPALKEIWLSGNHWLCHDPLLTEEHISNFTELPAATEMQSNATDFIYEESTGPYLYRRHAHPQDDLLAWFSPLERFLPSEEKEKTLCSKVNKKKAAGSSLSSQKQQKDKAVQYLTTSVTLSYFLNFTNDMISKCPSECHCEIMYIKMPLYVRVSCVNAGLTSLPDVIPWNTKALDISDNQISNLLPLKTNQLYFELEQLTAAHNRLLTLNDLADTQFINNSPAEMDFSYNQITDFDVDLLRPVFSIISTKHYHGAVIYSFKENPWDCACANLEEIQSFLYQYRPLILDVDDIACNNDQNAILIKMDYEATCRPESVNYMLIVVICEVVLLVLVLSKLAYDVWHYHRTGEMPWLARNICLGYTYAGIKEDPPNCCICCVNGSSGSGDEDSGHNHYYPQYHTHHRRGEHQQQQQAEAASQQKLGLLRGLLCQFGLDDQRSEASSEQNQSATGSRGLRDAFRPRRHLASSNANSSAGSNLSTCRGKRLASSPRTPKAVTAHLTAAAAGKRPVDSEAVSVISEPVQMSSMTELRHALLAGPGSATFHNGRVRSQEVQGCLTK